MGDSVFEAASRFFQTGILHLVMNEILLVLISKVNNPISVPQFRPVSLRNVIFKIFTKAMTTRLKKLLQEVVSPFQSSFVPVRRITDNIIIFHEAFHSLRSRKGTEGDMILEIDLEKAYDKIL